jgi:multidrug resistance efflux pump
VQGKQLDIEAQRQKQAYEQQDREHKLATDQAKAALDNSMNTVKAQAEQKQFLLESYLKERELELKNRQLDLQALELESKFTGSVEGQQPLDVPKANFDAKAQGGEADKFAELMNELRGHHANVLEAMKNQHGSNGVTA